MRFSVSLAVLGLIFAGCGAEEFVESQETPSDPVVFCGDLGTLCAAGTVCLQKVKVCEGSCDGSGRRCECNSGAEVRICG